MAQKEDTEISLSPNFKASHTLHSKGGLFPPFAQSQRPEDRTTGHRSPVYGIRGLSPRRSIFLSATTDKICCFNTQSLRVHKHGSDIFNCAITPRRTGDNHSPPVDHSLMIITRRQNGSRSPIFPHHIQAYRQPEQDVA
jgi:hypothetical protein